MGSYQSESRYYLHVQLAGIEPPIWRKILVPDAISLHTLDKTRTLSGSRLVVSLANRHVPQRMLAG